MVFLEAIIHTFVSYFRYELSGTGSELFNVDPVTGSITVAACSENCIDYETTRLALPDFSLIVSGPKSRVNL